MPLECGSEGTIQLRNYQFYLKHFYQSNQEEKKKRKQGVLLNNIVKGEHFPTALPKIAGADIGKEGTSSLEAHLIHCCENFVGQNSFNKWQQNRGDTSCPQTG